MAGSLLVRILSLSDDLQHSRWRAVIELEETHSPNSFEQIMQLCSGTMSAIDLRLRHLLTQTEVAFPYIQQIFRSKGLIIQCNLNLVIRDYLEPYNWTQKDIGIE